MRKELLDKENLIWNLREIVQMEERNNWPKKPKKFMYFGGVEGWQVLHPAMVRQSIHGCKTLYL